MKIQDRIRCEAISLTKARRAAGHKEHFTHYELDLFIPSTVDTNNRQILNECIAMESDGFLKLWGKKHGVNAYVLNIDID